MKKCAARQKNDKTKEKVREKEKGKNDRTRALFPKRHLVPLHFCSKKPGSKSGTGIRIHP
jgi:hypothetical protein